MKRVFLGLRLPFYNHPPLPTPPKGPLENDRRWATIGGRSNWRAARRGEFRQRPLGAAVFIGWVLLFAVLADAHLTAAIIGLTITGGVFGGVVGFKRGLQHRERRQAASATRAARGGSRNRNQ